METKTVYIALSPEYENSEDIYGVFDSRALLEEFLDRFKDRGDGYEVVEIPLNPKFSGDKSRNPYCLAVDRSGEANLYVVYHPAETEKAINNVQKIYKKDGELSSVSCHLLAETKEDALKKGMARIAELIRLGKFNLDGKLFLDNVHERIYYDIYEHDNKPDND